MAWGRNRPAHTVFALAVSFGLMFTTSGDAFAKLPLPKKGKTPAPAVKKDDKKKDPKKGDSKAPPKGGGLFGGLTAAIHAALEKMNPREFRRGLHRWKSPYALREKLELYSFQKIPWKREFTESNATLVAARKLAMESKERLAELPVVTLAQVLFILEMEGTPDDVAKFRGKVNTLVAQHGDLKVAIGMDVLVQTERFNEQYRLPCRGKVTRKDTDWPPAYDCSEKALAPTGEPAPFLRLKGDPQVLTFLPRSDEGVEPKNFDKKLEGERKGYIREYDKFVHPLEKLDSMPKEFCVAAGCHRTYKAVAAAIYGGEKGSSTLPIFCAPKKVAGKWEMAKVHCSAEWLQTLGDWKPWGSNYKQGEPAPSDTIPPFACFGSPHIVDKHMILPAGGEAGGSGFHCRRRIFNVMVKDPEMSLADMRANIAQLCTVMRQQVWGEKYPDINSIYQKWCRGPSGPKDKSVCLPADKKMARPGEDNVPFMKLSREELLYFYGHKELYCRAKRNGLVHFLYNKEWRDEFTCDIARGIIEGGPFEEGVQTCAVIPFSGDEGGIEPEYQKARLHCWRFSRPTCEQIMDPEFAEKKDSIHLSNVFDHLDSLKQYRRTHNPLAWQLFDMKDAEKIRDSSEMIAFNDGAGDEKIFGVKEFCRFSGRLGRLQCGYTKETIAHWYEVRKDEVPEGCGNGVCERGAYKRGYFCALFNSQELFAGRPYWMCGIDVGRKGRGIIRKAAAICIGGAQTTRFQSAKGDKSSLQCYARRFRWGESEKTEDLLRHFNWRVALEEAVKTVKPQYDVWLAGGEEAHSRLRILKKIQAEARKTKNVLVHSGLWHWELKKKTTEEYNELLKELQRGAAVVHETWPGRATHDGFHDARKTYEKHAGEDARELVRWAAKHGHTLGHRTSIRLGLLESGASAISVLREFKKLHFEPTQTTERTLFGWVKFTRPVKFGYTPLGDTCGQGKPCVVYYFDSDDPKERPVDKDKAKELNDLVKEVVGGERPPDGKWYNEFQKVATEDGQLRINPKQLEIALRVHHLFETLEGARKIVLRHARDYANAVHATAKKRPLLTRLELHEMAREEPLPFYLKGNVFCVEGEQKTSSDENELVCASSPLLVAGHVERRVGQTVSRMGNYFETRRASQRHAFREKLRKQTKFDWCYGSTKGRPIFGSNPSAAVSEQDRSSPFAMVVPPPVIQGARPKKKGAEGEWEVPKAENPPSAANWLKCVGFQYSDETWEVAPLDKEKAEAKKKEERGRQQGEAKASEGKSKMAKDVGGLAGKIVKAALGKFVDALERVKDLAHVSSEFLDKWSGKLFDKGEKQWDEFQKKIKDAEEELVKRWLAAKDKALEKFHDAEVKLAGAVGDAKAEFEKVRKNADDALKDAKEILKSKEKALKALLEAAEKKVAIDGAGDLLNGMLEDLLSGIAKRVTDTIKHYARNLLNWVFRTVRSTLDSAVTGIISAVSGIPFAGSGLAVAVEVAYQMAMNSLEEAAYDALLGVVERVFAKMVRKAIAPVFKLVQKKILGLVYAMCTSKFGRACPKSWEKLTYGALPPRDQWIERALACPGRPVIDDKVMREAAVAELDIMRTADKIRREAPLYARDFSDRFFAQYGHTTETWLAKVAKDPEAIARATAAKIQRDAEMFATRLRSRARVQSQP